MKIEEVLKELTAKQETVKAEVEKYEKLQKEFQVKATLDKKYEGSYKSYVEKYRDAKDRLQTINQEIGFKKIALWNEENKKEKEKQDKERIAARDAKIEEAFNKGYKLYFANYYQRLNGWEEFK